MVTLAQLTAAVAHGICCCACDPARADGLKDIVDSAKQYAQTIHQVLLSCCDECQPPCNDFPVNSKPRG